MNKRTLLVALVLLSVACAYASTVTIVYPTPVEGLDSHLANTTTAHDTAGTNATLASHASSLATLSADVVTRANINGSSTQNFSVATLTAGNVSGLQYFEARGTGSPAIGKGGTDYVVFAPSVIDYANTAYSAGTFTVPISGVYTFSGTIQTGTMNDGESLFVKMNIDGSAVGEIAKTTVATTTDALVLQFMFTRVLVSGQTVSFTSTTTKATDPNSTGSGCSLQMRQER
jgi:hypothetical protein